MDISGYPQKNRMRTGSELRFFSRDESYEFIYIRSGQEALANRVLEDITPEANRLVILESLQQSGSIYMEGVVAFCIVDSNGAVSYYKKQGRNDENR